MGFLLQKPTYLGPSLATGSSNRIRIASASLHHYLSKVQPPQEGQFSSEHWQLGEIGLGSKTFSRNIPTNSNHRSRTGTKFCSRK